MRAAAASARRGRRRPGKCQQVWCPVCALAALVTGEQHPLLTVVAEHSVALLAVVRAMVDDGSVKSTPGAGSSRRRTNRRRCAGSQSGYQHIPVTVEE